MREVKLVGGLESIYLHDGTLEVTFSGGQVVPFPVVDERPDTPVAVVPLAHRRGRRPKSEQAEVAGETASRDSVSDDGQVSGYGR